MCGHALLRMDDHDCRTENTFTYCTNMQVELEEGQSGPGNPTFTVSATSGGLTVELPAEMRKAGWFAVPPPPHKVAHADWQKGCAVRCVLFVARRVGRAVVGHRESSPSRSNCCEGNFPRVFIPLFSLWGGGWGGGRWVVQMVSPLYDATTRLRSPDLGVFAALTQMFWKDSPSPNDQSP